MATSKKTAKPAAKKPAAKPVAKKPVAKAAPAKKPAAKPAPKKAVAKPVAKKPAPKPVAKPVAKKPVAKAVAKPVAKPVVAKAAPTKPVAKATATKPVAKVEAAKQPAKPAKPTRVVAAKPIPKAPPEPKSQPIVIPKPEGPQKVATFIAKPDLFKAIKAGAKEMAKKQEKQVEIKVPKITAKGSVKYDPDFTKSVLDKKAKEQEPAATGMRYSDQDLNEFRELIAKKLDAAKKELSYLQGLITRKDEMGGDDTDNRYMTMEDGSMSMEREQLSQMASRQIQFIDHLEKALIRIENKTYGICRVTGRLIDKARLRAVPHATLSMEAKMGVVK
jgi:RNA polymerase-binding transcription factor DksA